MKVEDIEIAVAQHFGPRVNLPVPNASWGAGVHECDLLILSKSNYLTEVEIKTSLNDLKKDLTKRHGHNSPKIKQLYFAMPLDLYYKQGVVELIPRRAGILTVNVSSYEEKLGVRVQREAETNASAPPLSVEERYKIARLGALRIWGLKKRLQKVREAMK